MFNRKIAITLAVMLLVLGLVAGCSDTGTDPAQTAATATDQYDNLDFAQPFGGLTVSDEAAAFDDEALKSMLYTDDEMAVDDPLALDAEVLRYEAMGDEPSDPTDPARPRFTYVRLRWGMLHGPDDSLRVETECDRLDWTGDIHTDRGLVVVRRLISFERPFDHVIFPRLSPRIVAFVSHTGCGMDGLVLQVIERPAADDSVAVEPNRLHINTGPFQGVYDLDELAGYNEVIDVDTAGNRFQISGFRLSDITYCPKGFLSGRYRLLPTDVEGLAQPDTLADRGQQVGTLAGAYTDLTGRITGFMRGGYGFDVDGNRVFHAKYIGRRGVFRGRITGTWEPAATATGLATFTGYWESASGRREGVLGGEAHPVDGYPGGFYVGRWATLCDDEAAEEAR